MHMTIILHFIVPIGYIRHMYILSCPIPASYSIEKPLTYSMYVGIMFHIKLKQKKRRIPLSSSCLHAFNN